MGSGLNQYHSWELQKQKLIMLAGIMVHACHPRTWETEVGLLWGPGQTALQSETLP